MSVLPDEYQDRASVGSLIRAQRCWRDLVAADTLSLPQQFTFLFQCPTEHTAFHLMEFLKHPCDSGCESSIDRAAVSPGNPWQVKGRTHARVWSLSSLEHLFMRMRKAGARYDSALLSLDLLCLPPAL